MGSAFSRRRLILSALLGITIIVVAYGSTLPATTKNARATNSDDLLKTLASKDSDGDGLLDWQESLYGTDPQNPYSVQEGLLDSDALAQGLISPTASEAAATPITEEDASDGVAPGSLTAQFTQTFFSNLGGDIQKGLLSEESKDAAIDDLVEIIKTNSSQLLQSRYTISTISVQPGVSIDEYVDSVEYVLFRPDEKGEDNILSLVTAAVENDSLEARKRLGDLVSFYASVAKDLSQIPTPSNLADAHLKLVQSIDIATMAISSVSNMNADPLIALASISAFNSGPKMTVEALNEIMNVFVRVRGTPTDRNFPGFRIHQALKSAVDS